MSNASPFYLITLYINIPHALTPILPVPISFLPCTLSLANLSRYLLGLFPSIINMVDITEFGLLE